MKTKNFLKSLTDKRPEMVRIRIGVVFQEEVFSRIKNRKFAIIDEKQSWLLKREMYEYALALAGVCKTLEIGPIQRYEFDRVVDHAIETHNAAELDSREKRLAIAREKEKREQDRERTHVPAPVLTEFQKTGRVTIGDALA